MEFETQNSDPSVLVTPYMRLWIESGIMYCIFAPKNFDLDIAKQCVEQRIEFSKGISYPACVFIKNIRSADKEVRKYFAKEGNVLIKAGAIIIESPLSEALGNFFIHISKPNVPARLFTDKKEAEKWLREFI